MVVIALKIPFHILIVVSPDVDQIILSPRFHYSSGFPVWVCVVAHGVQIIVSTWVEITHDDGMFAGGVIDFFFDIDEEFVVVLVTWPIDSSYWDVLCAIVDFKYCGIFIDIPAVG